MYRSTINKVCGISPNAVFPLWYIISCPYWTGSARISAYPMPDTSLALRFERLAFIAFDLFLLKRPGAEKDYSETEKQASGILFESMTKESRELLYRNVLLGLPGSKERFTEEQILSALENL